MLVRSLSLLILALAGTAHAGTPPTYSTRQKPAFNSREAAAITRTASAAPGLVTRSFASPMIAEMQRIESLPTWRVKYSAIQLARSALQHGQAAADRYEQAANPESMHRALEAVYVIESLRGLCSSRGYADQNFFTPKQLGIMASFAHQLGIPRHAMVATFRDMNPNLPEPIAVGGAGGAEHGKHSGIVNTADPMTRALLPGRFN